MSTIKFLTYAQNVEQNRQALIQHCRDEGKTVSDDASLSSVVAINNTITGQGASSGDEWVFKRRVFNYDGTLLEETPVEVGDAITPPSTTPTIDDPLLEFDSWVCDTDETTVTHSYSYGAFVRPKETIEVDGEIVRPTIIKMLLTSSIGLSPTIRWGKTNTVKLYIDWGDGTVDAITSTNTSGTQSHTYATAGEKIIKMYASGGDLSLNKGYYLNTTSSAYSFGTISYNRGVTDFFAGDYFTFNQSSGYDFYFCENMEHLTGLTITTAIKEYCFAYCYKIKALILKTIIATGWSANQLSTSSSPVFSFTTGLETLIISGDKPLSIYRFGNGLSATPKLKNFNIPNKTRQLGSGGSNNVDIMGTMIEEIYLPDTVTTTNVSGSSGFGQNFYVKYMRLSPFMPTFMSIPTYAPIKAIEIPNSQSNIRFAFSAYNPQLEQIIVPENVTVWHYIAQSSLGLKKIVVNGIYNTTSSGVASGCYNLEEIYINQLPTNISPYIAGDCYNLKTLTIPVNWDLPINIVQNRKLSDSSLIGIAQNLKDNTGLTAKTLTVSTALQIRMENIFVDANGVLDENGTQTLTEYITGKNWTITAS